VHCPPTGKKTTISLSSLFDSSFVLFVCVCACVSSVFCMCLFDLSLLMCMCFLSVLFPVHLLGVFDTVCMSFRLERSSAIPPLSQCLPNYLEKGHRTRVCLSIRMFDSSL